MPNIDEILRTESVPTECKYYPQDSPINLYKIPMGGYSVSADGTIYLRCPLCGHVAPCGNHTAENVGTDHLTLSPSMLCATTHTKRNPCHAHYYVIDGKFTKWQSDSALPAGGFMSNADPINV